MKPKDVEEDLRSWSIFAEKSEFSMFLFGRKAGDTESVFEKILATKKMNRLIDFIWKKFQLETKEQILNLVKILK